MNKKIYLKLFFLLLSLFFIVIIPFEGKYSLQHYIVSSGDFYQLMYPIHHLYIYFSAWSQSIQGVFNSVFLTWPFYGLISLLDLLGIRSANIYESIILYISFLSFYFAAGLIYPKANNLTRIGGGFVYAINNFTLSIFSYSWGYTHQFLFYAFFPIIIGSFFKLITAQVLQKKDYVLFVFIFLLSLASFNNIAFLVLLFLVEFLILLIVLLLKLVNFDLVLVKRLVFIGVTYIVLLFNFLLPSYLFLKNIVSHAVVIGFGGNALVSWLEATSNNFLNSFSLASGQLSGMPVYLSILYIFMILFFLFIRKDKKNDKKLINSFLILFLVFSFLSVRIYGPFSGIELFIYLNPLFSAFRSADKIFSVLPFFYTILLVVLLSNTKIKKIYIFIVFVVLLTIPYQFYTGGIYQNLLRGNGDGYSYLVKIPKDYYNVRSLINSDKRIGSIISLPYSVINSINWSNYPKWHFVGVDVLNQLYDKYYISANTYDNPIINTQLSFKNFNEKKENPEKLLEIIQKFSGQYVFYHKDIDSTWIKKTTYVSNSLKKLTVQKKLALVDSNSYFDLYKVLTPYLTPLIHASSTPISFERVNPTEYKIYATINKSDVLVFNQTFDNQWKLYLNQYPTDNWCDALFYYKAYSVEECALHPNFIVGNEFMYLFAKPVFNTSHTMVNSYANAWHLDKQTVINNYSKNYYKLNKDGSVSVEMTLYYTPQTNFYVELMIQALTFVGCISYFGYLFMKKGMKK